MSLLKQRTSLSSKELLKMLGLNHIHDHPFHLPVRLESAFYLSFNGTRNQLCPSSAWFIWIPSHHVVIQSQALAFTLWPGFVWLLVEVLLWTFIPSPSTFSSGLAILPLCWNPSRGELEVYCDVQGYQPQANFACKSSTWPYIISSSLTPHI